MAYICSNEYFLIFFFFFFLGGGGGVNFLILKTTAVKQSIGLTFGMIFHWKDLHVQCLGGLCLNGLVFQSILFPTVTTDDFAFLFSWHRLVLPSFLDTTRLFLCGKLPLHDSVKLLY